MDSRHPPLAVKVWGPLACFTRPEMKVERVTYEVMTPSAARGVLEAIFWKPEFCWQVRTIEVLAPIRRQSIQRNEVKTKAAPQTVRKWADGEDKGFFADDDRTQRHTLALRDVAYVIHADIVLQAHAAGESEAKYRDQFRRRVARGQCFQRPYLGCREFAAEFGEPDGEEQPIDRSEDLGRMLLDLRYDAAGGRTVPVFFAARLDRGVLTVPAAAYAALGQGGDDAAAPTV